MKRLLLLLLIPSLALAQRVPLGETVYVPDVFTFSPSTGAETAADSTPACSTFEEATDTAIIVLGSMVLRTATTNDYRYTFAATTANGFEVGKWYNTNCYATVETLAGNVNKFHFRVDPPEPFEGSLTAIRTGTAVAGAATSITLDSGASTIDDFYLSTLIQITGGVGVGQARFISDYVGSTKVATVGTWTTNPDSTSTFTIYPAAIVSSTYNSVFVRATAVTNFGIYMQTPAGVALTGLTTAQIACVSHVDSGAWAAVTDTTETEVGGAGNGRGQYLVDLTATETDGIQFNLLCTGPGAIDYRVQINTQH